MKKMRENPHAESRLGRDLDLIDLDDRDYDDYSDDDFDDDYDDDYEDDYEDDYDDDYDDDYEDDYDDYDDEESEDDYYDEEDDYDDYEDDRYYQDKNGYSVYKYQEPKGAAAIGDKIADFFASRTTTDWVIIGTAVLAAILVVVVGVVFLGGKKPMSNIDKKLAQLEGLGDNMAGIDIIGEAGLLAMSDANNAREMVAEALIDDLFEEEGEEPKPEPEKKENTVVVMNLVSIQKDLKIKFIDNDTQKLVKGVSFEVQITDPSGNKSTQTDKDTDGIIYLKDIAAGKYKVALKGPENDKYSFSKDNVLITVKDKIEYKKVNVADEIKTEKDINASVEDTAKKAETESTLTDTVEWVESTKTTISEGTETLEEVSRDSIADPGKTSAVPMKLLSKKYTRANEPGEGEENQDPSPTPTEEALDPTESPTEVPTESPTESPTEVPTETPTQAPTQAPTATPTLVPTEAPTATTTPTATPTGSITPTPSVTPTVTPTPTLSPLDKAKNDTTSTLKTTKGEVLYIKNSDGSVREAKYADYYVDGVKFFKKTKKGATYKYTGWQTIDGNTYFYDKSGKPVTGEQVIQGAKYKFDSNGKLDTSSGVLGIDVSKWNGKIDWNAVKNSGISYVVIRCGYRGSSTGALVADPNFKSNIEGAKNAGLKVGVYFFSQAVDEIEAVEEASMTISLINKYSLAFPVFLDIEGSGGRGDSISEAQRTAVAKAFCQTIQNSGYRAGVYSNKTWFESKMDANALSGYKLWLAQYAAAPTYSKTRYDMWQYSSKGRVTGIDGNVDMNISYLGY